MDMLGQIKARQDQEKQQLADLLHGTHDVWDRDFGDKTFASALNPLLRTYTNRDNAANIHVPNGTPGNWNTNQAKEADHFLEIQHVIGVIMAQRNTTHAQLCQEPLGQWLKLSSFLAHPYNLYLIPKTCNTYKSHISFDLYKGNIQSVEGDADQETRLAFIKGYLAAQIDGDETTVADRICALCGAMKNAQGTHYTGLTRMAGECLEIFLGGVSKASLGKGFYDAKH
jgi:hypothetical protein